MRRSTRGTRDPRCVQRRLSLLWQLVAGWLAARLRDRRGFRKRLNQIVKKSLAFVKRLDGNAFITAVKSDVLAVEENALDSIRRNTADAKGLPVGRPHHHDRHHWHTWPKSF